MALNINHHVFKGHKTILGSKYVTYGEVELPLRYDIYAKSRNNFDWGNASSGSLQLAFSILYQLSNEEFAKENVAQFVQDVIKSLSSRDWVLNGNDVAEWIRVNTPLDENKEKEKEVEKVVAKPTPIMKKIKPLKKAKKPKSNVVKDVCKELRITQKQLAEILEVPEGTVSSWAVKNEIPRLGKKAIEFYILNTKNQEIVDSYKNFVQLLQVS